MSQISKNGSRECALAIFLVLTKILDKMGMTKSTHDLDLHEHLLRDRHAREYFPCFRGLRDRLLARP